jgi:hypothetical protein
MDVDIDKLMRQRPKRKVDGVVPHDYGTLDKPRICIDRVYFSIHSRELVKSLTSKQFRKDIYGSYYHMRVKMQDGKGFVQGLHFVLDEFEGDEIAWMNVSLREPHTAVAYVNFVRYFRKVKGIPKPSYGFYDTNFLPINYDGEEVLDGFCSNYIYVVYKLRKLYQDIVRKFGYSIDIEDVEVTPVSVEVPLEYLGHDIVEYEWLSDVSNCRSVVKYSDMTRTMYFNKNLKKVGVQLKFYQKAPGIARMELTFNGDFAKHYFSVGLNKEDLKRNILMAVDDGLLYYGLSLDKIKPLKLEHDVLLTQFAVAFGVDVDILKTLIYGNVGELTFNKDNQGLRRKLLAKGLIKKGDKKGVYLPSELVKFLKNALGKYFICSECGRLMFLDDEGYYKCPNCGYIKHL